MTALAIPTTTMPGQRPQESGGRLINCFVESLGEKGPSQYKAIRCPGMASHWTTNEETFRGGIQVGSLAYTAWAGKVNKHTSAAGAGTDLTGTLTGSDPVFMARNNASTPDLVIVSPGNGAFVATTAAVSAYPDADVGAPNSVTSIASYLIFSYGNGAMLATGLNTTSINTLDTATAESKPDTLYRVARRGRTLLAAGSNSIEFWDLNNEASGFPFSWTATHDRGIIHRYAFAGDEDGWGYGHFFVADDFSVRQLEGYASNKISPPDLDRLIEEVADKEDIQVSVYISQGHPFVVVQCEDWTWEYDVGLQRWHERKSYNLVNWRGLFPFRAFDNWMAGARSSDDVFKIVTGLTTEDSEPLVVEIETGPQGNFPFGARVNRLDLFVTAAVGIASGSDPIQTNPRLDIAISKDLGVSWSNYWQREIGPQGRDINVTVMNMGHVGPKGAKFKFRFSDQVHYAMIGGDFQAAPLRN